nr:hypothetical transcript [Hymenolepis microstoma]
MSMNELLITNGRPTSCSLEKNSKQSVTLTVYNLPLVVYSNILKCATQKKPEWSTRSRVWISKTNGQTLRFL